MATTEPNAARTQVVGRLTIETIGEVPATEVRLVGELGLDSTPALEQELFSLLEAGSQLAIDLSELEFIDSSGLQSLIRVTRRAQTRGFEPPRLHGATGQVRRVFDLTGADRALSVED